ncbi:porin [Pseudoduganella chitinolytica]|uniref:Porin n=1 Tax=Pseudoduganella chitinolytica TaxID=34070 RepID=A0ABY8B544_9BURK|nr:porin [Pseudoduganella chitinolytica]WEF30910.1 porin [Pseudoduganella chitinolytica]
MKHTLIAAAVLAATCLPHAQAATLGGDNLTISGFGTLAAARSNTEDARFTRSNQREGTAGTTTIGLDSNLGLQATYTFNDKVSATTQILSRKTTGDSFTTELAWAFVKYQVSDEIAVRLGRVVVPSFLISDYQNVGYANTMMRPPVEMYGQNIIETADGADINWQHSFGETNVTAQAVVGVARGKSWVSSNQSEPRYQAGTAGFAISAERGPITLRFAHVQAKLKAPEADLINALTNTVTAVGFAQLGRDITVAEAKRIAFTSVGVLADWNNIVVQAEYGRRSAKEPVYLTDSDAWYTMAGYRFGKVLPYYAHAKWHGKGSNVETPAALSRIPALNAAVQGLLAGGEQSSDIVGVRWDFAKSAALKVQIDRVKSGANNGFLRNVKSDNGVTVVAAGVDFVF